MEVWKKYEKDLKPEGYRPISRLQDFTKNLKKFKNSHYRISGLILAPGSWLAVDGQLFS